MTTAVMADRPAAMARSRVATILAAGAAVALLDGLFAIVLWVFVFQKATPARVFQGVASALVGIDAARAGGTSTALLGVGMHVSVAFTWAILYVMSVDYWPAFRRTVTARGPTASGIVYGALVWTAMDLVVIPFTRARVTPVMTSIFLIELVGHMILVGPPIAWLERPARTVMK